VSRTIRPSQGGSGERVSNFIFLAGRKGSGKVGGGKKREGKRDLEILKGKVMNISVKK